MLPGAQAILAYTPGTAIQALQRLAASNPMLYKALLHMKKDSHGCISTSTLMQVSCHAGCASLLSAALGCNDNSKLLQFPPTASQTPFNRQPQAIQGTVHDVLSV